MSVSPVLKANFHSTQRTNCARSAFQILIATEKIIQRLILAIGDPLRQASFYINARNKNHASKNNFFSQIIYRGGIESKCKVGYKGRMCNECNHNAPDGNLYGKTGAFTCQICPNLGVQTV
jgi:hypothetical protein